MEKYKNTAVFTDINKVPAQYPWLAQDEECEVLVVGGSVSGCLTAHILAQNGIDVILISKRPIGISDGLCDSGRLDYQNELLLSSLTNAVSREDAVFVYEKYRSALNGIESLSKTLENFSFEKRDSFLFTNDVSKLNTLHTEYLLRKHNGFDVSFIEGKSVLDNYSFPIKAGILAKGQAGVLDPYLFCHALIKDCINMGVRVYENTSACEFSYEDDSVITKVSNNFNVTANKVVLAIGANQQEFLNTASFKKTSFFTATDKVSSFCGIKDRAVVKSIDKNITFYVTNEDRIIANGLDCTVLQGKGKFSKVLNSDRLYDRKYNELEECVSSMLCGIPDLKVKYRFTGGYAETKTNLPIIGESKDFEHIYFNMPSSINGILSSYIGAQIIAGLYLAKEVKNPFAPKN